MKTSSISLIVAFCGPLAAGAFSCPAKADVFVLDNGGRIEGELLNPDQSPRQNYVVRMVQGGQITLAAGQVQQILGKSKEEQRYEEILPRMPETADGHWRMGDWCRQYGLKEKATFHFQQVLDHDPEHEPARRALGYSRVDDRWVKADQWMKEKGYVRHQGSWRVPQDVELESHRREVELAEKQWKRDLKMWRSWLSGRRLEEARENIRDIRDPLAAQALAEVLAAERHLQVKLLLIEVLGKLDSGKAVGTLIDRALGDDNREVRISCVEQLDGPGKRRAVAAFIHELQSKDNKRVNRAAVGLSLLGDRSAIRPLIEALATKHRFLVSKGSGGNLGATFGRTGSGGQGISGFGVGGGGPKLQEHTIANQSVLDALISLCDGTNYQFDKQQWLSWYVRHHTPREVNLRRDS